MAKGAAKKIPHMIPSKKFFPTENYNGPMMHGKKKKKVAEQRVPFSREALEILGY